MLGLGLTVAIAAAAVVVALSSHSGARARATAADPPYDQPSAAEISSRMHSPCVVSVTDETVCGRAAADYCNLVVSHAMSLGPAQTSRCVTALRRWSIELSRTYELNEETNEDLHGS